MRTWRWFSVFAVLALVLAACGSEQGGSPSEAAESEEPATQSEEAEPSEDAAAFAAGRVLRGSAFEGESERDQRHGLRRARQRHAPGGGCNSHAHSHGRLGLEPGIWPVT